MTDISNFLIALGSVIFMVFLIGFYIKHATKEENSKVIDRMDELTTSLLSFKDEFIKKLTSMDNHIIVQAKNTVTFVEQEIRDMEDRMEERFTGRKPRHFSIHDHHRNPEEEDDNERNEK